MAGEQLHHGVDIVDLDRIEQAVTRWGRRFLQRVWTAREPSDASGRLPSLAARVAAKEATAKALGGLRGFGAERTSGTLAVGWHEIEVVRAPSGRPSLRLHGRAAVRAVELGWQETALSLSHARHVAIASVVARG